MIRVIARKNGTIEKDIKISREEIISLVKDTINKDETFIDRLIQYKTSDEMLHYCLRGIDYSIEYTDEEDFIELVKVVDEKFKRADYELKKMMDSVKQYANSESFVEAVSMMICHDSEDPNELEDAIDEVRSDLLGLYESIQTSYDDFKDYYMDLTIGCRNDKIKKVEEQVIERK